MYKQHPGLFLGYAAWLLLPYAGLVLLHMSGVNSELGNVLASFFLFAQAFFMIWITLLFPLMVKELVDHKKLQNPLQQKMWKLLPSAIFVALLETAVVLGGLLLLVIPGIVFAVWFMFALPSVLLDGTKGVQALTLSRALVRGRFWRVAWLGFGGPSVILLAYVLLTNLVIALFTLIGNVSTETLLALPPPLWVDIVTYVAEIFFLPWVLIYGTLLYLDVKEVKSTSTLDPLAE